MNKRILLIGLVFLLMIASAFAVGTAPDNDLTEAYYALENLTDSTPNAQTLTNVGTATSGATGKIDDAYDFDGTNDYIYTTSQLVPQGDAAFSINAWVDKDDTAQGAVWSFGDTSGSQIMDLFLDISTGNNEVRLRDEAGGGTIYKAAWSEDYSITGYVMLTVVIDTTDIYVYENDVQVATGTKGDFEVYDYDRATIGAGYYIGTPSWFFNGTIDEVSIFNYSLTTDEIAYLYQTGTPTSDQQYPFASATASDEIIPQVVEDSPDINITVSSSSYVDIYTTIFSPLNDTTFYPTATLSVEGINKAMGASCRLTVNGTDYNSEVNRSLLNNEIGNLYLFSTEVNGTNLTDYEIKVQCNTPTAGAFLGVSNIELLVNIDTDFDGTPISHEHNAGTYPINSTSYQELFTTTFETSNLTGSGLEILLTVDGRVNYNYVSTGIISLYAVIDNSSSAVFERGGSAGTSGSGSGLSLVKNATANQNVTFSIYGKSTSGDGSVDINSVLSEFFTHQYESTTTNLSGTTLPTTSTWTTIKTVYVNNTNHATNDMLVKTSISTKDSSGVGCTQNYRIKAGTTYSQSYPQTLTTVPKVTTLSHLMPNPGLTNQSLELQTSNNCDGSNNLSVTGGALMAYIVTEVSSTPQFYIVSARNDWDNASITAFNVTTSEGTVYQSNATGNVSIYHVNGLDTFTLSSTGYFNRTYTDHNTTTNLFAQLYNSDIKFIGTQIITGTNVTGNITIDGVTKETDTSFYLSAGTHEATFTKTGYFTKVVNFTITALQNDTLNFSNLGNSLLTINATNVIDGTTVTAFNFSFIFNGTELENYTVTNGTQTIPILQGYNYTIFVDDNDHAQQYFYFTPDELYYNYTLGLSEINSILITFYDEVTGDLINGTNMTASIIGGVDYILTTTNGTIFKNLIVPADYEIRYYSTVVDDYKLRSAFFTLTPLSFQEINLYSFNTSLNASDPAYTTADITFLILDNNFDPVPDQRIVVQRYYTEQNGFVSVFERLSNSEGEAVGTFETIDSFYKYNVYDGDTLKFSSSNNGVQFTGDNTITIYIDTTENYGETFDNIYDLADVSDLAFVSTGNFTGYFELNYTNPNLINICLDVRDINNVLVNEECQTTSVGTIQISVSAPTTKTSVYVSTAQGYDPETQQYIVFDQETKTFKLTDLLGANSDINSAAMFVVIIILTGIALLLIRFPVVALLVQAIVYIFLILSPIPFLLGGAATTISWVVSVIITAIFILIRGKNE